MSMQMTMRPAIRVANKPLQESGIPKPNFFDIVVRPQWLAETVGFEPTIRGCRIHTFQACAFDHSATSPRAPLLAYRALRYLRPETEARG